MPIDFDSLPTLAEIDGEIATCRERLARLINLRGALAGNQRKAGGHAGLTGTIMEMITLQPGATSREIMDQCATGGAQRNKVSITVSSLLRRDMLTRDENGRHYIATNGHAAEPTTT